jgi:hypothetical protein
MNPGLIDGLRVPLYALLGLDAEWSAVVIAAVTALVTTLAAAPARLLVDRRLQRSQVEVEYEHEQRKALRAKIGTYHGRLLEAALDMNYRLVNLNVNWKSGWLNVGGDYRASGQHYFRTTAFRFVRLAGLAHKFEREAIVVDARIAEGNDQAFVRYPKAFRWVMTDVALFGGVDYDSSRSSSHFFTDHLRQMCSRAWGLSDEIEFTNFEALVANDAELDELLEFFDGIEPTQLRWDRLMSLQLLLMAFINTFGYEYQGSDAAWFDRVVDQVHHDEIVSSLRAWIPKLGLGEDQGTKDLDAALARRLTRLGAG